MLRKKSSWAILAVLAFALAGCTGSSGESSDRSSDTVNAGPKLYTIRGDLCDVLDYQEFSRLFGTMQQIGRQSATEATARCGKQGEGPNGDELSANVQVYRYGSSEEAKQLFATFSKEKSDMDVKLNAKVDDMRFYNSGIAKQAFRLLVLDDNLYVEVAMILFAEDPNVHDEIPKLAAGFADQVLERLREKS